MGMTVGARWHDEAEAHVVRDGVAVGASLLMGWILFTAAGCYACFGTVHGDHGTRESAMEVADLPAPHRDPVDPPEQHLTQEQAGEIMAEVEREWLLDYPQGTSETQAAEYAAPHGGLTAQGGVNYFDGRTETYYSSNVLYHYRTDEWTVDSEGFYRTDEGYYVVAASDMEQGTVFEGSKGECIVLDSGCAEGVTDYYVAW